MRAKTMLVYLFSCLLVLLAAIPIGAQPLPGEVYTMTNDPLNNEIVVYDRDNNGFLTFRGTVSTGGLGSGGDLDALGSQGSLVISQNQRWLLAVNAGSDSISVFRRRNNSLTLKYVASSGGDFPTSLAILGNTVYVLNSGSPNVTGYHLSSQGVLTPISFSTRYLSAGTYSQIGFDNTGRRFVVTDRENERILVFAVSKRRRLSFVPGENASQGSGPFGFLFDRRNRLVVTEANSGAVSSYGLVTSSRALRTLSASVPNGQLATCWIAAGRGGYLFTSNTGSNTISSYWIGPQNGDLTLLQGSAGAANSPLDLDTSVNGRFLYVLNAGDGSVGMFKIRDDGSLEDLGTAPGPLAIYAQGLVAR